MYQPFPVESQRRRMRLMYVNMCPLPRGLKSPGFRPKKKFCASPFHIERSMAGNTISQYALYVRRVVVAPVGAVWHRARITRRELLYEGHAVGNESLPATATAGQTTSSLMYWRRGNQAERKFSSKCRRRWRRRCLHAASVRTLRDNVSVCTM